MAEHIRVTYNEVHNIIKRSVEQISEFKPDLVVAIGGGGFFPARVLRTFLKGSDTRKNVPIYAICLSLYEPLPGITAEKIGSEVIRTQWLGPEAGEILLGKRVLIVDEVDDSRTTLQYAISELRKDTENALQLLPHHEREGAKTKFAVFVVHNKLKPKVGSLPADIPYYAGEEVDDLWLDYPWEATDIEEHDRLAAAQKKTCDI
ncbi:phosphoribosyltransferase-like protein [Lactarius psammicola]|nr:phosphoribosyltransferase-like protein [Lactarius psammicola]